MFVLSRKWIVVPSISEGGCGDSAGGEGGGGRNQVRRVVLGGRGAGGGSRRSRGCRSGCRRSSMGSVGRRNWNCGAAEGLFRQGNAGADSGGGGGTGGRPFCSLVASFFFQGGGKRREGVLAIVGPTTASKTNLPLGGPMGGRLFALGWGNGEKKPEGGFFSCWKANRGPKNRRGAPNHWGKTGRATLLVVNSRGRPVSFFHFSPKG